MVPRDALVLTEPINSPQAAYRTSALPGSQMGISGMKNLSVTPVAGAKQKQEWALHFRDSSHSCSEIRDRTLRNARENRQNDLPCVFRDPDRLLFSQWNCGDGKFSYSFRFNEIDSGENCFCLMFGPERRGLATPTRNAIAAGEIGCVIDAAGPVVASNLRIRTKRPSAIDLTCCLMGSYDLLWRFALLDPLLDDADLVKGVGALST